VQAYEVVRPVTTSTGSVGQILYRRGRLCGGALIVSRYSRTISSQVSLFRLVTETPAGHEPHASEFTLKVVLYTAVGSSSPASTSRHSSR
jgi:hypothetical protein